MEGVTLQTAFWLAGYTALAVTVQKYKFMYCFYHK